MSNLKVLVGNVVKSSITWAPADGGAAVSASTCRVVDPAGTVTSLTVTGSSNSFAASHTVPDGAIPGRWYLRWEATAGSLGAAEDFFEVIESSFASP